MKIKVLVIDDNRRMIEMIKKYFSIKSDIDIVLEAYDGVKGYELISKNTNEFDVILLDLIMPKKDGLYVLEMMEEHNINKNVIILTCFSEEKTISKVCEYGVMYFMLKPFELADLERKIHEVVSYSNKNISKYKRDNIEIIITRILNELGIPSHIKGYNYIREAISLTYLEPELIESVTKKLYLEIANRYNTTTSRVERAIRHAIEVSWIRGDWDLMESIFGHSVDIDKAKPTNSEFIVTIADKLRLDMIKL